MVLANILIIISYHLTLGKQKFLHRMGAQEVTSQKALDNSWVQDGSPGECRMGAAFSTL